MNYYERHLGDYARDTAHLSLLEHGAYTILLDRFYVTEQGIPADQVHRIARAKSKDEKAAVDAVLAEFFVLENGAYIQKRAMAEIQKAQTRINAARANGKTGGRPKRNPEETHRKPTGFISETQSKAFQSPISNLQSPEVLPSVVPDARDLSGEFEGYLVETYPTTAYRADFVTAAKSAQAIVSLGKATWPELRRRVAGYRDFCRTGGASDPSKIATPQKWFALHQQGEAYWAKEWAAIPSKAQQQQDANIDVAKRFLEAS